MHNLVGRPSRGPRSAHPWANTCGTAQLEKHSDQIPIMECEAAAVDYRFQRMAVLQFAQLAI